MNLPRRQFLHLAAGAALFRLCRGSRGRKHIRHGRCASSSACRRRLYRHCCTPDGPMAFGAAWPAIHHREPDGCRRQYCHRGGCACPPGRLYAAPLTLNQCFQRTLYDELNFNYIRDIAPVAGIIRFPFVMVVSPSFPATTVPEFIAYAKANLGQVNMASAGVGSGNHLRGELFKIMAGVNMFHVPYRGEAPALADMLGGQVQVIFSTMPGTIEYITSGRLRPLAVTTATRSEALPDIPTIGEFLPRYDAVGGMALAYPSTRPPRSSTSSTRKSTLASQIPNSRRGLPTWARQCSPVHPPNTASSSQSKPRSGPR